jgi:outer membrane protein TolC
VLQAETNVAQREEQLLLRDTEVMAAADRLKAILYPGTQPRTWDAEIAPTTPLPEPPDAALDLIPRWGSAWVVAQESRSELRQQRLQIESREVELVRAASDRRPSLDLLLSSRSRGFDGDSADAFDKAIGWDFPQNTAALTFSVPIGNRTARNALERARADLRAARLSYDQLESQIIAEVRTAIRQVTYSVQAVAAADKNHELAKRQLEAEQARYREGLSTNFLVLEFQQQLAEALYSRNLARVNLAKSLVNLQQSQGILGEVSR